MLDPFLGIGHSALAAKKCGIDRFIGFEIDPEYVRVAKLVLNNDAKDGFEARELTFSARKTKKAAESK